MPHVPLSTLWDRSDSGAWTILWKLRIPRVLMGLVAGAGLAISGMAFQAVFRNPLATPFTLGVASGASLGACAYIHVTYLYGSLAFSSSGCRAGRGLPSAGRCCRSSLVYGLTRSCGGASPRPRCSWPAWRSISSSPA